MLDTIARLVVTAWRVPVPARWLAVLAWAGLIFLLSAQQGLRVSQDPGVDRPIREVAHGCTYAVLTILLGWALSGRRAPSVRVMVAAATLAFLYGISDEWHQTFVPTRTGRPQDLIWDGIGILIGVGVLLLAARVTIIDRGQGPPTGDSQAPE